MECSLASRCVLRTQSLGMCRFFEVWRLQEGVQPRFRERHHFGVQAHQTHAVHCPSSLAPPRGSAASLQDKSFFPSGQGFGSEEAELPNLLAKRTAALAQLAWLTRAYFGIENPMKSILWDLKSHQKLAKQDGVKFIEVDMCKFGGTHKGQTGILTNCEWIQETLCSQIVPHKHVHYKQNDTVWFTSLVNEHPEQWNTARGGEAESLGGFRGPFFRGTYVAGPRQQREEANFAAIGGLRNPNHAVARSRALRETGLCARGILGQVTRDKVFHQEVLSVVASLGTPDYKGFSPELLQDVHRLLRWFPHQEGLRREATGSVRSHPLGDFARACARPKLRCVRVATGRLSYEELASRSSRQTAFSTPTSGPSSAILAAQDSARLRDLKGWSCEDHRNYASFYTDSSKIAADEITRIEHKGFIETFTDWKQVTERWPNAVASKVVLLLKTQEDGTTKVRLIIDLRRLGGNGGVELPQRVVLPRLSDLTNSILDLMLYDSETMEVQQGESIGYDLSVVDFEDAFHTLAIREQDRGVVAIRSFQATLLWNGSGTGCMVSGQCCCSAPGTGVFSTKRETDTNLCRTTRQSSHVGRRNTWALLLFLCVLGFTFNWRKAHRGSSVPWIGAQVTLKRQNGKWGTLTELMQGPARAGQRPQTVQGQGHGRYQTGAAPCRAVVVGFWFIPVVEMFQHHALGCHHGARDRAVLPEVVQEETTL